MSSFASAYPVAGAISFAPGRAILGGAGIVYDSAAMAIFAAFTTSPTAARKKLINSAVVSLKNAGVWALLDFLYVMDAADSQAARVNWVNPATFTLSAINAPTFTADRGFLGDGATSYLNTGFNPATAAGKFTQNSNHLSIWVQSVSTLAGIADCGTSDTNIATNSTGSTIGVRDANSTGASTVGTVTTAVGFTAMTRSGSANFSVYKDGSFFETVAQSSNALASNTILLCARNNGSGAPFAFATRRYSGLSAGSALSAQNNADLHTALLTYNQAVGAS